MRTLNSLALVAASVPMLVACHGTRDPSAPVATPPSQTADDEKPKVDPAIEQLARAALQQAGIAGELKLLSAERVQWGDSSLGCRKAGHQYTQGLVAGHVLQFGTGERKSIAHEVHVAGETAIVCSPELGTGVVQRAPTASRARNMDVVIEEATRDLAQRLSLKLENVQLRNLSPTTFDDNRLGCGAPPNEKQAPPVAGYKLLFSTISGNFIYHADNERAVPCPPIEAQ